MLGCRGGKAATVMAEVPAEGPRGRTKGLDSPDDILVHSQPSPGIPSRARGHARIVTNVDQVFTACQLLMHIILIISDYSYSR